MINLPFSRFAKLICLSLVVSVTLINCKRKITNVGKGDNDLTSLNKSITKIKDFTKFAFNHQINKGEIMAVGNLRMQSGTIVYKTNVKIHNTLGEKISISANMFGLLEVAKIYIDKKLVKINIVSNRPQEYSYEYFKKYVPIKFDINDLQNLLLGLNLWQYANYSVEYIQDQFVLKNNPSEELSIIAKYNKEAKPLGIYITLKNASKSFLHIEYNDLQKDNLAKHLTVSTENGSDKLLLEFKFNKIDVI